MLSVVDDKQVIAYTIKSDPYIQSLGFQNQYIYKSMTTPDLIKAGNKQIFIYNAPGVRTVSEIESGLVYQIDVSVPTTENYIADICLEQIQALILNKTIRKRPIRLFDPPRALAPSIENFYIIGMKIVLYSTIFNKKRVIESNS
ncbi:MAG: hypothetical protein HFE57_03600 [Firmicutes bacterium]|jgi:hypothetical protein|nr:hypothetical protein [Bacillota bacterium]